MAQNLVQDRDPYHRLLQHLVRDLLSGVPSFQHLVLDPLSDPLLRRPGRRCLSLCRLQCSRRCEGAVSQEERVVEKELTWSLAWCSPVPQA